MNSRFKFYFAIIGSLLLHLSIIILLSLGHNRVLRKPLKTIEVTYQKIEQKKAPPVVKKVQDLNLVKKKEPIKDIKLLPKDLDIATKKMSEVKDISKLKGKLRVGKKKIPQIETKDISRKVTVPVLKSEKISNPKYLSYNQSIRAKIKQKAYSYIHHADFATGEVYLTFVLTRDGELKQLKIIEDRTNANEFLRDIGFKSIEESQPFSAFPKDLNYPELTFNIVISFQVGE